MMRDIGEIPLKYYFFSINSIKNKLVDYSIERLFKIDLAILVLAVIELNYIKENPNEVIERLAIKGKDAAEDIAKILELDTKRRALIAETESFKAEQNKLTKMIPQYKKEGKDPVFVAKEAGLDDTGLDFWK